MLALQQDPASLEILHDIIVPGASPWWPPAPGWYVLVGLLLIGTILMAARAVQSWRSNRYRTAALKELSELRQNSGIASKPGTVAALNQILKRAALVAWPREQVSALSGTDWIDFLNGSAAGIRFTSEQTEALRNVAYSRRISENLTSDQLNQLFETAERWIRRHQVKEIKA